MLDAVASYVVQRVRKQHINAVSRPADLSALVVAFAELRHNSVAVPELIRAVTQQVCKGVASAHELLHDRPEDFRHLAPHTHWAPAPAAALLRAQLRLGFLPPRQQLRALAAALLPRLEGAPVAWGDALALLDAFAGCGFHPGEPVMDALMRQAEAALPPSPSPGDLVTLLFACARLGHPPRRALLAAAADGAALAGGGALRAAAVVRGLWALAALGALSAPRYGWLLVQLSATRWTALSNEQLAAVAAARAVLGADGDDMAAEILPADLARRVDAAWRGHCRQELAAPLGGGGGAWAAGEAAVGAWLAAAAAAGGAGGAAAAAAAAACVPLPGECKGSAAEYVVAGEAAPGAWVVPLGLRLTGVDAAPAAAAPRLLLLAPRGALLAQRPPRLPGDLLLRARMLAALGGLCECDSGGGGGGGGGGGCGGGGSEGGGASGPGAAAGATEAPGDSGGSGGGGGAAGQAPLALLLVMADDFGPPPEGGGGSGAPAGAEVAAQQQDGGGGDGSGDPSAASSPEPSPSPEPGPSLAPSPLPEPSPLLEASAPQAVAAAAPAVTSALAAAHNASSPPPAAPAAAAAPSRPPGCCRGGSAEDFTFETAAALAAAQQSGKTNLGLANAFVGVGPAPLPADIKPVIVSGPDDIRPTAAAGPSQRAAADASSQEQPAGRSGGGGGGGACDYFHDGRGANSTGAGGAPQEGGGGGARRLRRALLQQGAAAAAPPAAADAPPPALGGGALPPPLRSAPTPEEVSELSATRPPPAAAGATPAADAAGPPAGGAPGLTNALAAPRDAAAPGTAAAPVPMETGGGLQASNPANITDAPLTSSPAAAGAPNATLPPRAAAGVPAAGANATRNAPLPLSVILVGSRPPVPSGNPVRPGALPQDVANAAAVAAGGAGGEGTGPDVVPAPVQLAASSLIVDDAEEIGVTGTGSSNQLRQAAAPAPAASAYERAGTDVAAAPQQQAYSEALIVPNVTADCPVPVINYAPEELTESDLVATFAPLLSVGADPSAAGLNPTCQGQAIQLATIRDNNCINEMLLLLCAAEPGSAARVTPAIAGTAARCIDFTTPSALVCPDSRRVAAGGAGPELVAPPDEAESSMKGAERKRRMLQYVREVEPKVLLEEFLIQESPVVIGAMRQTISNMLGTITATPQFFTVTISTVGENLAMLMNTVMLTGYMFKSAEERFRLKAALGYAAGGGGTAAAAAARQQAGGQAAEGGGGAPQWRAAGGGGGGDSGSVVAGGGSGGILDERRYAPGVQKSRVEGEVLMWHKVDGVEAMPAVEYIELLEAEVLRLRRAAEAAAPPPPPRLPPAAAWGLGAPPAAPAAPAAPPAGGGGGLLERYGGGGRQQQQQALAVRTHDDANELLEFIRALDPLTVGDLTAAATPEVAEAMDSFVERLLGLGGGADRDALRRAASETDAAEMRQLLFWLMVVGWKLRAMEVQIELERQL
ncbi:MAG: hypothetical protein J3K34DRAFT_519159 [Monoraphidium minutum]|nr:MAG: hypothetical protein J3K34DRAFT_519159 [Monoraphidium minutum]